MSDERAPDATGGGRDPGSPSVPGRPSTPAKLTQLVGGVGVVLGVVLGVWSLTWSIPSGPDQGLAAGLVVLAIFFALGTAAILSVLGLAVVWYGRLAATNGWIRGPAIVSLAGVGALLSLSVAVVTGALGPRVLLNYWSLVPVAGGGLAGWRWSVRLRRRAAGHSGRGGADAGPDTGRGTATDREGDGDAEPTVDRPGVTGLIVGLAGVVLGVALALFVPPLGTALALAGLAVAAVAPAWFWLLGPALGHVRS